VLGWGEGEWGKPLSIILAIIIVAGLAVLSYMAFVPKTGEKFTEFYMLGSEGKASDYPQQLVVGEEGRVILVIVNHEIKEVSYRVEVTLGGERNTEVGPLVLGDGEKWQERISFTPKKTGNNQRIEFWLYKNGESEPYMEPLCLWIDVEQP